MLTPGLLALLVFLLPGSGSPPPRDPWIGVWTYDMCHEDRKPGHDKDTFCREGRDRIRITRDGGGAYDILLCPSSPWGETDLTVQDGGKTLAFKTREGLMVRLGLTEDRSGYRGLFRSTDGHTGRIWGRRVAGCR